MFICHLQWTDKWAERAEREGGGAPRRWGDKWTQEFNAGKGGRWGETWSDDPGGAGGYSRKWSEDHYGDGTVRKWGQSSDGEHWENTVHEDTWYEGVANVDFANARDHSPQLLNVPLRGRAGAPAEPAPAADAAGGNAAAPPPPPGDGAPKMKPPVRRPPTA